MALVICPDCAKEISDAAPACPGCGRPADSKRETRAEIAPEAENAEVPKQRKKRKDPGERVLFEDALVKITNVRAVIAWSQTTYAMSNVTSVSEFVEPRPTVYLLLALILVAPGLLCAKLGSGATDLYGWLIVAFGLVFVAGYFMQKPTHWVRISTAGAETNAVGSIDAQWTKTVVAAMNEAIITRG